MIKTLFVLLLLIIISVSGCTSNNIYDLADISKNPEKYINENVKVQGKLEEFIYLGTPSIRWDYFLVDDQGYKFPVKLPSENREFYVGSEYRISGKVAKLDYCYCERRYVDIEGDFISSKFYDYIRYTPINFNCNNPVPILDISGEWHRTSYSNTKKTLSSCISKKETIFNCTYNYKSKTYRVSFKDEYRCDPETIETIYYIEAETMTKI